MTSDLNATFGHRPFIKDRREALLRLSLPRVGKVASGASRIGFWRYEKERGDRLKCVVYESTLSTAARSPLSHAGNAIKLRKSLAT